MRRVGTWVWLALALIIGGCKRPATTSEAESSSLAGRAAGCNVLLVTLDTTRADRLGCYGWEKASTPVLDALARQGVRFERAFAQVPVTLPSHTVLLTGTYPPENGVRDNGRDALGPGLSTLAELFRRKGYRTGAFVAAAVLDSRYGLDQGFEVYDDTMVQTPASPVRSEIPADLVCDRALSWLKQVKSEPFLCWVHFFDAHTPYLPPAEYRAKTDNDYDGEIAFVDANIGRLVDWLNSEELLSRTLIVAVGDHGESLGEHGYKWHSLLVYDSTLRVPLLFSLPDHLPRNVTRRSTARVVDIMPTVLELMGWPLPPEVSGESLVAILHGQSRAARVSYGETDHACNSFGWAKLRCLVDGPWKYIRGPELELYDLSIDPGELRNLAKPRPDLVVTMEEKLAAFEAGLRSRAGIPAPVDSESLEALRSLGYVGGGARPAIEPAERKNPKDMVDIAHDYRLAEYWLVNDKPTEAIKLLEPAAARSPESFVIVKLLGEACAKAGRPMDSQRYLTQAVALYPESVDAHTELAATLGMRGRLERSIRSAERALAIEPTHERARSVLDRATTYLEQQREDLAYVRAGLHAKQDSIELRLRLGKLLAMAGNAKESATAFGQGLIHHPTDPRLAGALAWILATSWDADVRNGAEAVRLAKVACREAGEHNVQHHVTLAAAHAEAGQFEEAMRIAREEAQRARKAGNEAWAAAIERQIKLYEAGRPYRELP